MVDSGIHSGVVDGAPVASASKYDRLIAEAKRVAAAKAIVVHPCDETSLRGAAEAAEAGIISPILVGPAAKIKRVARRASDRYRRVRDRRRRAQRCRGGQRRSS